MSRINQLIAELCPEGVEYRKLGEVAGFSDTRIAASVVDSQSFVGVDNLLPNKGGKVESSYVPRSGNLTAYEPGDVLIGNIRPYLKKIWCASIAGGCSGDVLVIRVKPGYTDTLVSAFLYQILSSDSFFDYSMQHAKGAKMPRGSKQMTMYFPIPIPPLEIQREIVKILDTFTELEAELEAELKARKTQYAFYRDSLLNFEGRDDVRWATLGEVGDVSMCKRVFKNETSESGDIPFFKIGTFGGSPDAYISRELFEEYRSKHSFPKQGDILISAAGTIGRAIPYNGTESYFQDSNIVWIDNNEALVKNTFLLHWYRIVKWSTEGGTVQRLYNSNLRKTPIPIPPLAEQERIVEILDQFDALVNDLASGLPAEIAARRKQYEYYRDRLLTFKEKAA